MLLDVVDVDVVDVDDVVIDDVMVKVVVVLVSEVPQPGWNSRPFSKICGPDCRSHCFDFWVKY